MAENKGVLPSSNVNTLGNANNKWENVYSKKFTGALTGNASTASSAAQLTTARSINGTNFNGTGNITTANWGTARNISIADATATNTGTGVSVNGSGNVTLKLPATIKASLTGNVTGNVSGSSSSCTGNAATATKLATARTINIQDSSATNTGTGASFDGSGNATIKLPATIKANVTGNCSGSSSSCTGNSATATKATQDSAGQQINTTYIKGLSISGNTITYTKGNGGTGSITVPTGAGANGYITESRYNTDGSWYRKWSDGWLEQGGIINRENLESYTGNITNFVKPFSSTSTIYSFYITGFITAGPDISHDDQAPFYREIYPQKMTNTSFFIFPDEHLSNYTAVRYYAAGK